MSKLKIINIDTWLVLNLNNLAGVFINDIPVDQNCCAEIAIGENGYVVVSDLIPLIDKINSNVKSNKIKGNVEVQLKSDPNDTELFASFGLKVCSRAYQEQLTYTLVEL